MITMTVLIFIFGKRIMKVVKLVFAAMLLLVTFNLSGKDYYWVGGTGYWSDINHWATSTGGSINHVRVPSLNDNVYFDSNSFNSQDTIIVNLGNASCKNMDWTGALYNPTFMGSGDKTLRVSGSLTFIPNMVNNFLGRINFDAKTKYHTITTAGHLFKNDIYFLGANGGWLLADELNLYNKGIYLIQGSLNTNGQNITCSGFYSTTSNSRNLNLRNSVITLNAANSYAWKINGTNLVLDASKSVIKFTGYKSKMANEYGGTLTYNNIEFLNTSASNNAEFKILNSNVKGIYNKIIFNGNNGKIFGTSSVDTLKFFLNGYIDGDHTVKLVNILGYGKISGNNTFEKVKLNDNGDINGSNSFDTLILTPGKTYKLEKGKTQVINKLLDAKGSCTDLITIKSTNISLGSYISKPTDTVSLEFIQLKGIRTIGGAIFQATNSVDLGSNIGWDFIRTQRDLYWVGGTGNWNDPLHWSFKSGGTGGECTPTTIDNVYFDNNSFSGANQKVTINIDAVFNNMDWTGVINTPTLRGTKKIQIYGSLTLSNQMVVSYSGRIYFEATTSENTIKTAGNSLNSNLYFIGSGGGWKLLDDLNIQGNHVLYFYHGTLNTNSKKLTVKSFYSYNTNNRILALDNSTIIISNEWKVKGNNLTLSTSNSILKFTNSGAEFRNYYVNTSYNIVEFENSGMIFSSGENSTIYHAKFNDNGTIYGNNNFNILTLTPGKSYLLEKSKTQTINGSLNTSNSCSNPHVTLKSTSDGDHAYIRNNKLMHMITTDRLLLKDIHAVGSGFFIANNSYDLGNNTGWTILSNSRNLYWVGSSGTWSDANHWSFKSGGNGGACIPGPADNVFFDKNSFKRSGEYVIVDIENAYCKNMNWLGANNYPMLTSSSFFKIKIFGSLTLIAEMNFDFKGKIYFDANTLGHTIISAGKSFNNDIYFSGKNGGWILGDNLNAGTNDIYFNNGNLNTNGKSLTTGIFNSDVTTDRSLLLGNSTITLNTNYMTDAWNVNGSNLNLDADSSNIIFTGNSVSMSNKNSDTFIFNKIEFVKSGRITSENAIVKINDLSFKNSGTLYFYGNSAHYIIGMMKVKGLASIYGNNEFDDVIFFGDANISGNNTFNNLVLTAGKTYKLKYGQIQTINNLIANGNCTKEPLFIESWSIGRTAYIKKSDDSIVISNVILRDIHTQGTAKFIAKNSTDLGNNTGWVIDSNPFDLFWVGNSGNWNDPNHWSYSSGGNGGACIPKAHDNVYFDSNSFTKSNQTITVNSSFATFNNMSWNLVKFNPSFAGTSHKKLRIYGTLTLSNNMDQNFLGSIFFEGNSTDLTITSKGHHYNNHIFFEGIGAEWILQDEFNVGGYNIYFNQGSINSNGQNVKCNSFYSYISNNRTLTIDSSIISVKRVWSVDSRNLILSANNSLIEFSHPFAEFRSRNHNDTLIYNNVKFKNKGILSTINGISNFNKVDFYDDGILQGDNIFDSLEFSNGKTYQFQSSKTQTINKSWDVKGDCHNIVYLKSSSKTQQANISSDLNIELNYVALKGLKAVVGGSFTAINSVDSSNNTGWNFENTNLDLYWVGGSGTWTDPLHWSFISGGTGGACIPRKFDNVYFDSNSFISNDTVYIDQNASCNNMDWKGAKNNPMMKGNNNIKLNIHGSLNLISSMSMSFNGRIYFKSNSAGNQVTTSRYRFNNHVYFDGIGGEWIIQDYLNTGTHNIYFNNGTLKTNGSEVQCNAFFAKSSSSRILSIDSSLITINSKWEINNKNLSFDGSNSTLSFLGSKSEFINRNGNDSITYYNVTFHGYGIINTKNTSVQISKANFVGNGEIYGNNIFDTLSFSQGKIYKLESDYQQIINDELSLKGNNCFPITLKSTLAGSQAILSKLSGSVSGDFLEISDINAIGGASFNAGEFSVDVSNNMGWKFTNGSGYVYGLGNDTNICTVDELVLNTNNFNGGTSYTWQDNSTGPVFKVTEQGQYWVKVDYAMSCSITDSVYVNIHATPKADFVINDSSQCLNGNSFDFNNLSKVDSGELVFQWIFESEDTIYTKDVKYSFAKSDTFNIHLIAVSNGICSDTAFGTVYVNPDPKTDFSVNLSSQCLAENKFYFYNSSVIESGSLTYNWNFGDETFSTSRNASHSYVSDSIYKVALKVKSDMGCTESASKTMFVAPMPKADFEINDHTQCLSENDFVFNNKSSIKYGSVVSSWNFGDLNTSIRKVEINPSHSYNQDNVYKVNLIITSNFGCSDSITKQVKVLSNPETDFTFSMPCLEKTTQFVDNSIVKFPENIVSWEWIFGDGDTSNQKEPLHIYSNSGDYGVKLTAQTSNGCTNEIIKTVSVQPYILANSLTRATVNENDEILIEWDAAYVGNPMKYTLQRSFDGINFYRQKDFDLNTFEYIDNNVTIDENYYAYRIIVTDSCGHTSQHSNKGTNILLKVDNESEYPVLSWNNYEEWESGVKHYLVQFKDENISDFITIMTIKDTTVAIDDIVNYNQSQYCYRIIAISNDGKNTISTSNEACISTPFNVWIPNSFTPNNDGLNDQFRAEGRHIINYQLTIFDRWGKQLFITIDVDTGWDGMYKGEQCPTGNYYYQVFAQGTKAQSTNLSGSISLIR